MVLLHKLANSRVKHVDPMNVLLLMEVGDVFLAGQAQHQMLVAPHVVKF